MTTVTASLDAVPINTTARVPVNWLRLDHLNPRLVAVDKLTGDSGIVAQLYRSEELGELLQSIAANGYLDIEPLVVLREADALTVLEGNRRLAAVRIFREPQLVDQLQTRERLRLTIPDISPAHRATLDNITVYRVASRDDARSFIGFKHINGAAKWDSYAKAKFAADWYRSGSASLQDIAERIGDKHDTIKRMVNAIYVLEQAHQNSIFSIDDRYDQKFNFSHLYTALSRTPYMEFLGLNAAWSRYDPQPFPVDNAQSDKLGEILRWIYGSKEDALEPVVKSQNPHIKELGDILLSAEGLAVLRATGSLAEAFESTRPANEKFSTSLLNARRGLREAVSSLRGFDGRDQSLVDIAEDVSENAQALYEHMRRKQRNARLDDDDQ